MEWSFSTSTSFWPCSFLFYSSYFPPFFLTCRTFETSRPTDCLLPLVCTLASRTYRRPCLQQVADGRTLVLLQLPFKMPSVRQPTDRPRHQDRTNEHGTCVCVCVCAPLPPERTSCSFSIFFFFFFFFPSIDCLANPLCSTCRKGLYVVFMQQ